ncbi:MAG: hypothetical protein JXB47_05950 [Anaerolineae bacterium]|nr:hypothetical protein [Anaerolineae bacterium]
MAVSVKKARDFVYSNGALWERALFAYLFETGSIDHVHECLLCYKNRDGGWGHGLEPDITYPGSHPLALEFLLNIIRDTGISIGGLLAGTVPWVEYNRNADGSLRNPPDLLDYPHAPWWSKGGQTAPTSIVGNLSKLRLATPTLAASTRRWAEKNLVLEHIQSNTWLFMAYQAHDYYMNISDLPSGNIRVLRAAVIENIIACAEKAPENQYYVLFSLAPTPDARVTKAIPEKLVERNLDYLYHAQHDDGGWEDEHGLAQWRPYTTIISLLALKRFGRLNPYETKPVSQIGL